MLLAGITVMAVLFFGLGGSPTDEIVILPVASTTLAPAATPTTDAANTSDSDTLVAVTTTVGMVEATLPPEPLGTLAPVEGLGVPTLNAASSVSTVGIDRVMFGMTLHDAQVAAGSQFTPITPVGHCFLVVPEAGQAGLTFWVVAGTVERVDVDTRTITTRSGAGIGDTEERIRELFGERICYHPSSPDRGKQPGCLERIAPATHRWPDRRTLGVPGRRYRCAFCDSGSPCRIFRLAK